MDMDEDDRFPLELLIATQAKVREAGFTWTLEETREMLEFLTPDDDPGLDAEEWRSNLLS